MSEEITQVPWGKQMGTFARRYLQQLGRNKMIVFLTIGWPVLWYFMTMILFIDAPAGTDLGPMKAANGISFGLFGAFTVTVAVFAGEFARDLAGDRYRKLRSLPIAPTADLASRFVTGAALGSTSYLVTVVVAYVHGATFQSMTLETLAIIALTLVLFCLIAMALAMVLALVVTKPEHMTTIAVVTVLMAFFVTGYNGTSPGLIANFAEIVNYLPNSLATRMQIAAWVGTTNLEFMTPPEAPLSLQSASVLLGYAVVLLGVSTVIIDRVAYGRD